MTTKEDYCLKDKHQTFDKKNGIFDGTNQFKNINLNHQNYKCAGNVDAFLKSGSKSSENGKKDYYSVRSSKNDGFSNSWKKKGVSEAFETLNRSSKIEGEQNKWTTKKTETSESKNKKSSSTLSLHIAAYENSVQTSESDKNVLGEPKSCKTSWKNGNSVLTSSNLIPGIQDSFEFPRQNEDESMVPEVMQFQASQVLFNPNGMGDGFYANGNLLFRTITVYSTLISTGLFAVACFTIIIALCDRKKKKSQAQQPPGTSTTPKSAIKPAQLPSSGGKIPSSPLPGNPNKNDLQASQKPKEAVAKTKGDIKSARQSNKMFAGALDKTQEESKRSANSNSKESGENKNHKKEDQAAPAKETKDAEKKDEEEKKLTEPPPIVPEDKVQVLGNLDDVIKEKKTQLVKEIEDMGSVHEHDKVEKEPLNPEKHVIINEKKCKLYTTNNEETKEDDAPDDLI